MFNNQSQSNGNNSFLSNKILLPFSPANQVNNFNFKQQTMKLDLSQLNNMRDKKEGNLETNEEEDEDNKEYEEDEDEEYDEELNNS